MKKSDPNRPEREIPTLEFDKQICFSLYSASNSMIRAYRPLLESIGLTYLQYIVMMVLWKQNGINITDLGTKLGLDSGTMTPLLKRLEAKDFISRKVNEDDERSKQLWLTESGKALERQAQKIPEKILCDIDLPFAEIQQLKQLCDKLLSATSKRPVVRN